MSRSDVERFYDRVGVWQDTQRFYEDAAIDALVSHGEFEKVGSILEVGCGTGRVAEQILSDCAPPDARYRGFDLSKTMVRLSYERLARFGDRVAVAKTTGGLRFDEPDASFDRVVATYVFDLLSPDDARTLLDEAHRLLCPTGCFCVAGLTRGAGVLSTLVSRVWATVHAIRPQWVGGCRPVEMRSWLCPERWSVAYRTTVTPWGIPSEVLIARPL